MHERNAFITLTYSPENLPADGSLNYRTFQLFMKRLRKHFAPAPVRFYMCGEYGDDLARPHYHACLFGVDFPDKTLWQTTPAGSKIYRSETLEALWPLGFSSIGDVTFESAAYVARYILKKINGDAGPAHYGSIRPEFTCMSRMPGLGSSWFAKYLSDVYPHDRVVVRGKQTRPPRYYDILLKAQNPELLEELKFGRETTGRAHIEDNTDERLADREAVAKAGASLFSRKL